MFLRQMTNLVLRRAPAAVGSGLNSNNSGSVNTAAAAAICRHSSTPPHLLQHQQQCRHLSSSKPTPPTSDTVTPEPTAGTSTSPGSPGIDITNSDASSAAAADSAKKTSTDTSADTTTVGLLAKWRHRFEADNVPEVDSSLRNILAHVLRVKRLPDIDDAAVALPALSAEQEARFEELCECRLLRMPIQYIIGEWDFRDLTLQMRPPVFIPRPETEELVELVLQQFDVKRPMRFLEIGCGSGAISLALLKSLPKAVGVAIDQSEMACALTLSNAQRHQLDGRLTVRREKLTRKLVEDISNATPGGDGDGGAVDVLAEMVDLMVSNPPYVPNKQLRGLQPEVKIYEDLRALDGGVDGMDTIESILWLAAKRLRPTTGVLWLEVDPSHPALIQKYLAEHADTLSLKWVASYADIFRKDRFVEIVRL